MNKAIPLAQRALREALRSPEAILPTLFIPIFFLVVNVGQAAKIFPSGSTDFLQGQNYAAFQLPSSILLAASFGSAALFLVSARSSRSVAPPGVAARVRALPGWLALEGSF